MEKTNIKGLSVQQLFHIQTEDMKTPLETKGTILHFNNLLFLQSNLSFLLSGHLLVAKIKKMYLPYRYFSCCMYSLIIVRYIKYCIHNQECLLCGMN